MTTRAAVATQVTTIPANSEGVTVTMPMTYARDGSRPAVVHAHGGGGSYLEPFQTSGGWDKPNKYSARSGFPTLTADMGGQWEVGNDNAISRVDDAVSYAQSTLGASTEGVILSGSSMGFPTVCNWARQNPEQVIGIMGFVGGVNLEGIHDQDDPAGVADLMDTAYGGHSEFLAALPTHDPYLYGATDLAGIPLLFVYSTDENGSGSTWQATFVSDMQTASPGLVTAHTQIGGHALTNTNRLWIYDWLGQFR